MAALFNVDVRTVNEHLKNVYEQREVTPEATIRKFRIVRLEGARHVSRRPSRSMHGHSQVLHELVIDSDIGECTRYGAYSRTHGEA